MTTLFILFVSQVMGQHMCSDLRFKKLLVVAFVITNAKPMQSELKILSVWLTWNCLLEADWQVCVIMLCQQPEHAETLASALWLIHTFNNWLFNRFLIVQHILYTFMQSLAIYMRNDLFFILHISLVLIKSICPVWIVRPLKNVEKLEQMQRRKSQIWKYYINIFLKKVETVQF